MPRLAYLSVAFAVAAFNGCGDAPREQRVQAEYDKTTGKLSQLTVDVTKDGKPNITSYMDGSKFLRIEIDTNEDGKIDRWEYYSADQKLERVGFSRANDGTADAWAFHRPDGSIERVEVSTKRDGKPNRTSSTRKGRWHEPGRYNGDGRVDKWER